MGTRLHIRTGTPPARVLTLAEKIDAQIDRLYELRRLADNERRTHSQTDQMIDGLDDVGTTLRRIVRGG